MVLKVISPDIFDRSEVGGRATHVKDEQQLKSEFEKLSKSIKSKVPTARITGITIQAMLEKIDHEVMLGARQDSGLDRDSFWHGWCRGTGIQGFLDGSSSAEPNPCQKTHGRNTSL